MDNRVWDAVKRKWNGEKKCIQHGCRKPAVCCIKTEKSHVYACATHREVAGGTKPRNIIAAKEKRRQAEERRKARQKAK